MAKDFPHAVLEFEHWFRTEEACRDYLVRLRWPDGFRCPRCGHDRYWKTRRGLLHCAHCRKDTSVMVGTLFEGSNLPLRIWFRAMWWVTNQKGGVSALGLQRAMGLGSYRTAWMCLHKLRRAMVRPGRDLLTGVVEVDETYLGGERDRVKGRRPTWGKAMVAIAAEARGEGIGRIRMQRIPDDTQATLEGFVRAVVAPGSKARTDGHAGYYNLRWRGYDHDIRIAREDPNQAHTLLPRVHRVAALLKRWVLGIHQGSVSEKHLDYYLDEFTFRFNRRTSTTRGMLFWRLVQQAVAIRPLQWSDLVAPQEALEPRG